MQLTLVRHGEAVPAINGMDSKRPLTERGHLQAKQTAQFLKETVQPDVFVVSTLLRAQETLSHIQAYFPEVSVLICDKIKPEDDAKLAIEWLSQLPFERIVVVCHMNVVGHIAEQLTHEHFNPFALAETRIYEQTVIANGLSTQDKAFIPTV
ncbi:MAG: 2,3-bisphosphoglycerate-dependent phosphoglycerate mutase [Acinetobacter bereziniae]|uniref:2,3-bisphosphoglycerate-dependent phosphoglycerate mutase n=1 Tax=Acinetobacter bereziniae TaxID=106648 RepID=A0A833UR69_ACIBZ|nr:MAG: 2,3-bisphosphoglycerate-dependent phosphoglycerate mutase [Acinetobacter bereziniae]